MPNEDKSFEHPLEGFFEIEPGTTLIPGSNTQELVDGEESNLVEAPHYDDKDKEIEQQLEDIRTIALDAFEEQQAEIETVEGRYKARLGEVAAQYLNIALNAIKEKNTTKLNKDKNRSGGGPQTVNNNLIIDRNTLVNEILSRKNET